MWTVIRIPALFAGHVVDVTASFDPEEYAVALFGKPLSPARILEVIGSPLSPRSPR